MIKRFLLIAAVSLPFAAFATNYCADCDRPIADSKTLCTRCQEKRDRANAEAAEAFVNWVDNGVRREKEREDRERQRRNEQIAQRDATDESILANGISWHSEVKAQNHKFEYVFDMGDDRELYAYVFSPGKSESSNYIRMDISNRWFKAGNLFDFGPVFYAPNLSGLVKVRLVIKNEKDVQYGVKNFPLSVNGERKMCLFLTELPNDKIKLEVIPYRGDIYKISHRNAVINMVLEPSGESGKMSVRTAPDLDDEEEENDDAD